MEPGSSDGVARDPLAFPGTVTMRLQAPRTGPERVGSTFVKTQSPGSNLPDVEPDAFAPKLTTDCIIVPHDVRSDALGDGEGLGVFATEPIAKGTICIVFGGFATTGEVFRLLPAERQHHSLQIGDDLFLACDEQLTDGDFVNHACEPSLWFVGEITLVAMRDVEAGEQLTFDYATCDSQPYDEFECECGSPRCRVMVTGEDWTLPDLQARYSGHFSPYLQRRIDALAR